MFPNAAISLSADGITALLKADDGWRSIGQVPFDDPDLTGSLEALRLRAEKILGAPMRSKLIIPTDQIRFLETPAIPDKIGAGQAACAQVLEGQTPYPVSELRYDWLTTGTTSHIAAVAVETLTEAEAFATQYGLNPICFVGLPEINHFGTAEVTREPYFGTTKAAANLLNAQQSINRETGLAIIMGPWANAQQSDPRPSLEATNLTAEGPAPSLDQAEALKLSGIRQTAKTPSKPRYFGHILTGVLLAALFAVTLNWKKFDSPPVSWSFEKEESSRKITSPTEGIPAPNQKVRQHVKNEIMLGPYSVFPAPDEIADAAGEDFEGIAALTNEAVEPDQFSPQRVLPATLQNMTVSDAKALLERSGIWQRGIEPATLSIIPDLEATYFASLDPLINFSDPVTLPSQRLLRQDAPLPRIGNPAAPGQKFDFNENGLVNPTANGAATPDGITVFAGKPPVFPPVRYVVVPEPLSEVEEAESPIVAFRPRLRPQSLSDANEREMLHGYLRAELAALRPKLRPSDLAPALSVAAGAINPSRLQLNQAQVDTGVETALATAVAQIPQGTTQAVRVSPKPNLRPRDLEKKQTAALASQAPQAGATATVTKRPNGAVNSTIARNATLRNAIRLNQINLIGVSGKPNARNALVRLKNGRYRKVTVGDRLDGGRVTAIGRSDLRYSKSGRQVKLDIPSG